MMLLFLVGATQGKRVPIVILNVMLNESARILARPLPLPVYLRKAPAVAAAMAVMFVGIPESAAQTSSPVARSGVSPESKAPKENPRPPAIPTSNSPSWQLISPTAKTTEKVPISNGQGGHLSAVPGKKLVVVDARLEHSGSGPLTVPVEEIVMELVQNSSASSNVNVAGVGIVDSNATCQIGQALQGFVSGSVKTSLSQSGESLELTRANAQAALKMTVGGSPTHLCFVFAIPQEHQGPVSLHVADAVTEPIYLATLGPSPTSQPAPAPQPVTQPVQAQPLMPSGPVAASPERVQPNAKQRIRKNFFESIFTARFELGAGGPFGGIISEEEKSGVTAVYGDGSTDTQHPTHTGVHVSPNIEVAAVRLPQFKLAFRLGYHFDTVQQDLSVGGGQRESKSWTGTLLSSNTVLVGPVFYVNFGKGWYGSFEGLAGPMSGTLHPLATAKQVDNTQVPDVNFGGWRLLLGPGFGYAFGTLLLGGDLTYGLASVNLDQAVYVNLGKQSTYNQIGFNAYVGAHL